MSTVPNPDEPLVEERDYTIENGLFVLTRGYLLRRGFCCGSGCRNCPYATLKKEAINAKDVTEKSVHRDGEGDGG